MINQIDQELLTACTINSWSIAPRMMLVDSMIEAGCTEAKAMEVFEPPTASQYLPLIYYFLNGRGGGIGNCCGDGDGNGYREGIGYGDGYGSGNGSGHVIGDGRGHGRANNINGYRKMINQIDQELLKACVVNPWSVVPQMMLVDSMIENGWEEVKAMEVFEPPTASQCLPSIYGSGGGRGSGVGRGSGGGVGFGYGVDNGIGVGRGNGHGYGSSHMIGNGRGHGRGSGYNYSNGYRTL